MNQKRMENASSDMTLFRNPTKEYRGAPFWAWNGKLDEEVLAKEIDAFDKMGFGGYFMHPRQGLADPYLGDKFLDAIAFCVKEGKSKGLSSYLYDEDRWPSGYAGGLVTKKPRFRQRVLVITRDEGAACYMDRDPEKTFEEGLPYPIGCYDIRFDKDGYLDAYRMIDPRDEAQYEKYYAYSRTDPPSGRYNFQTYVDIMQKEAIQRFIAITHMRYRDACGSEYGKAVPAIFSDEPRHAVLESFSESSPEKGAVYYWTYEFDRTFQRRYGYSLTESLPHLIWDTAQKDHCHVRLHYFHHAQDLFEEAFFQQIHEVTHKQKILWTGHLMNEHTLLGQIERTGDAMRLYPYFDLPGIDVLFDRLELSTVKQAQSIVHQYGKPGLLSEMYGVTGWDFDFACMKAQGDWQAALGVTLRVPHLSMMSMAGRAKRDYPASFGYQSPWYEEYRHVEDHFARLNVALGQGRPVVRLAVVHPIESTMLRLSTREKSSAYLRGQEEDFQRLVRWLLYSGIDFDFLCEALLPGQAVTSGVSTKSRRSLDGINQGEGSERVSLCVGKMEYFAVIVPDMATIRESTIGILEDFLAQGGKILFLGDCPGYVDGRKSERAKKLYEGSLHPGFEKSALLEMLEEERLVWTQYEDGTDTENLICRMVHDEEGLWLFLAQAIKTGKTSYERRKRSPEAIRITLKGVYHPVLYDTVSGEVRTAAYHIREGETIVEESLYASDSLLLRFRPAKDEAVDTGGRERGKARARKAEAGETRIRMDIPDQVRYKRSEPNVVLLDVGEYRVERNGRKAGGKEYVLEMNRRIAKEFGFLCSDAQPYLLEGCGGDPQRGILNPDREGHDVTVCFTFESTAEMNGVSLALERAEACEVTLNGERAASKTRGYYVDASIPVIRLPRIQKGQNHLVIKVPFSPTGMLEPCYLLGEFDVSLRGSRILLLPPSDTIGFGPLPMQGMPFYGGNLTYHTEIDLPEAAGGRGHRVEISVPDFGAHEIKVYVDGKDAGWIAFSPFRIRRMLSPGRHRVDFLCYGNRNNTFGPVHNRRMKDPDYYVEPDSYEKDCESWRNGYFLQDTGILSAPVIEWCQEEG